MTHLGGWLPATERHPHGDNTSWCPALWKWMLLRWPIRSVCDIGCGPGYHLEWFRSRGLEACGIEGDPCAVAASRCPEAILLHDLTTGPCATPTPFDLLWCCETVEHINESHVDHILATFRDCAHANTILAMTHGVVGQGGIHHVNCQEAAYWIDQLAAVGFVIDWPDTLEGRRCAGRGYFLRSGLIFRRERQR